MDDNDSSDDMEDFQIESSFKRKKKTKEPKNAKKLYLPQDLGTDEKCAEMNCFLVDILPDEFDYKVHTFTMLEESPIAGESKFHVKCRENVRSVEEWDDWYKKFCLKSTTSYNKTKADSVGTKKIVLSGFRKCIHNVRKQKSKSDFEDRTKGPGRKKGQPRVPDMHQGCTATFTFQLAGEKLHQSKSSSQSMKLEVQEYPLLLDLHYTHNHSIKSADALRYRPVAKEVDEKLLALYDENHSPSSAYQAYKDELAEKYGPEYVKVSADRSIMPDYFYVFHLFAHQRKNDIGSINGIDSYQRAVDKIKAYNEKHKATLAKIRQTNVGETVAVVCDEFSQRCHENLPQAGDVVLVDATSNLNRQNTQVFHIMTPSAIGALPLGTLITSSDNEETVSFALDLYKSLLTEKSFYGRGPTVGPKLALTDDSKSERNALMSAWPTIELLLCLFHVLQAVWAWLWKGPHGVAKQDRPPLFNAFKKVAYAETDQEFSDATSMFDNDKIVKKYPNFSEHVEKDYMNRKEQWAIMDRIAKKLGTHGNNTTNYVESSFRFTKENQFKRLRAYNVPELLDVLLDDSQHYVKRCIDVGNNRIDMLVNQKSRYLYDHKTNINIDKVQTLGDGTYRVPSERDDKHLYYVDMKFGFCECPVGLSRGPCKHKHILARHFNVPSLHTIPKHDPQMRAFYH